MADPRFFVRAGPFTLGALAKFSKAELGGGADSRRMVMDVAPLGQAGPSDVSFLDNPSYVDALRRSGAGACILAPRFADQAPTGMALLLSNSPYLGYAQIARAFYPEEGPRVGVHPAAIVHPTATLGKDVSIEAYAVVGERAEIGDRVRIGAQVAIGPGVGIGEDTVIAAGASLRYCLVGKGCQIHSGARIGERGFGFATGPEGFVDMPQLGRVIVEDRVEVGANSTIDRGATGDTVIGAGTRIDNLVQIAHNVVIGRNCIIVAQAGVAGSSKLEDRVVVAAQGGVAGHLRIGAGAQVGAQSGVMRDVAAGERVLGSPSRPAKEFFRIYAAQTREARSRGGSSED